MARNKNWEDLEFTDDYLFKTVLTKYPRVCKRLLETILEIDIRHIKFLGAEEEVQPQYDSHGIRLDVYVEDDSQTVYTVDMQVRNDGDEALAKRLRYYQSAMDMDVLKRGAKYKQLKQSFVIFLCPFRFMDGKRHLHTFKSYCKEEKDLLLPDGATKIILASKGEMDDVSFELKCLLDYMNTRRIAGNLVTEIADAIKEVKNLEEEAVKYMTWKDIIDEERDEAREEGRAEGRVEGRAEGFEQITLMLTWLQENDRIDDALHAGRDMEFQKRMLAEYKETVKLP